MIALVKLILQAAVLIVEMLSRKQLLNAGQAEALTKVANETQKRIKAALDARRAALDGVSEDKPDKYRRD